MSLARLAPLSQDSHSSVSLSSSLFWGSLMNCRIGLCGRGSARRWATGCSRLEVIVECRSICAGNLGEFGGFFPHPGPCACPRKQPAFGVCYVLIHLSRGPACWWSAVALLDFSTSGCIYGYCVCCLPPDYISSKVEATSRCRISGSVYCTIQYSKLTF